MELIFLAAPLLLALLVPRAWAGALLATLALVWLAAFMDFNRVHANAADVMGLGLLSLVMMLMLGILVLRSVFVWRFKPPDTASFGRRSAKAYCSGLAATVAAAVLTTLLVRICNSWLSAAWITHLVVAVGAVVWWLVLPRLLTGAMIARWVGAATMLLALVWSMQTAQKVVQAAQAAADGQAYCLQVAGRDGLLPVHSMWEMAGFSMHAGRGDAMRHAQLAIGSVQTPAWRYWSYRKSTFEEDSWGGVLTCVPRADSVAELSWWPGRNMPTSTDNVFWLVGGQWRLPETYGGRASAQPPSLHFYAEGKDFHPLVGPLVRAGPQPWSQIVQAVDVSLCAPTMIHPWYQAGDAQHQVRTLSMERGLARQEVVTAANQVPRIQYVETAADGRPVTWIACDGPDASCHHAFVRDGMRVEFMHAAKELSDWKTMQDVLWQRIRSFAVTWPESSARNCASRAIQQ